MKKIALILSIVLLMSFCCLALCACHPAAGDYKFKSAKLAIVTITADQTEDGAVSLSLKRDRTYSFSFNYGNAISITENGTWKQDGDVVTFTTSSGDEMTATYQDKELTWKYSSVYTFVFTK
ncbi:MAG: hypothetical protein J6Y74_03095 [Clostridia bacterium]|nr:hypothetical protein [Clostridia bacterium]